MDQQFFCKEEIEGKVCVQKTVKYTESRLRQKPFKGGLSLCCPVIIRASEALSDLQWMMCYFITSRGYPKIMFVGTPG